MTTFSTIFLVLSILNISPLLAVQNVHYATHWRPDSRCGTKHLVETDSGSFVESHCQPDPAIQFRCCSKWGWCGTSDEHCLCGDECAKYVHHSVDIPVLKMRRKVKVVDLEAEPYMLAADCRQLPGQHESFLQAMHFEVDVDKVSQFIGIKKISCISTSHEVYD